MDIDYTIKITVTCSYGNPRMSIPDGNMKQKTCGLEVQHFMRFEMKGKKTEEKSPEKCLFNS